MARVVVVGGGISGLAVASELIERAALSGEPLEVSCYEAGNTPGGAVRTERADGFLLESGPLGLRESGPAAGQLLQKLGLSGRRIVANAVAIHHVFRGGRLRPLPRRARDLVLKDALPLVARLRVLAEPLAKAARTPADEPFAEFAVRRVGRTAGTLLADALATAVCAGDPERLSMRSVFPILRAMEADRGSLHRALRSGSPVRGEDRPLLSFPDGLGDLTGALTRRLGDRLILGVGVCSVSNMGGRGVRVVPEEGPELDVDAVVLACPAADAAAVVEEWAPELASDLSAIPAARVARVHLGFRDDGPGSGPPLAGFVAPRGQGLRMLGAQCPSAVFPGRAPTGSHLLTVSFGGAQDPGALDLDDAALVSTALADLGTVLGPSAAPYLTRVVRDATAIPQYEVGHGDRLARIEAFLRREPAVHLSGCSYRAREPGACLDEASRVADAVLAALARQREPALA